MANSLKAETEKFAMMRDSASLFKLCPSELILQIVYTQITNKSVVPVDLKYYARKR